MKDCLNCGNIYQYMAAKCDRCGSTNFKEIPDHEAQKLIETREKIKEKEIEAKKTPEEKEWDLLFTTLGFFIGSIVFIYSLLGNGFDSLNLFGKIIAIASFVVLFISGLALLFQKNTYVLIFYLLVLALFVASVLHLYHFEFLKLLYSISALVILGILGSYIENKFSDRDQKSELNKKMDRFKIK